MSTLSKTLLTCPLLKGFKNQDRMTTALRLNDNVAKISGLDSLKPLVTQALGSKSLSSIPETFLFQVPTFSATSITKLDQESKWKPTSDPNHTLEAELHASGKKAQIHNIPNWVKERTSTTEPTHTKKSYLGGIDGQSLQQEPAGIQMKTIMNQEVSKIDQRDILIFMWSQIKCFLQTGDGKGAISNCTPVQSSFIKHKPQRIFRL